MKASLHWQSQLLRKKHCLGGTPMAIFDHARRRGLARTRRSGRMSIDDMVRSTDVTVHIMVIALLIVFAFAAWYFYGSATVTLPSSP
jgi:hypothetical protein